MVPAAGPRSESTKTSPVGPLPSGVEERWIDAGGVRFRYLTNMQPGSKAGRDAPILFLHGYPMWAEVWLPLAATLGGGRDWIAPDLPCHNQSSALPGRDRSITAYRRAITALFDALHMRWAILVGSSLGGTLGIMLALDRSENIERLVVLDAAGLVPTVPKQAVRLYVPFVLPSYIRAPGPGSVRRLLERAVFHDSRLVEDAWVRTIADQWRPRPRRSDFIATGNALRRPDASVTADLPKVRAPTLIVWGRQDPQFDWHIGEAASHRIPNARFAAIEDCGHFPMVEKPLETGNVVSEFLGP